MTAMSAEKIIDVLEPGLQSTVQDYPGRPGMMRQGFFPAGAMDHFALRAANLIAGNEQSAAGLEVVLGNIALRFGADATVAVCGAEAELTIDGEPVPLWEGRTVRAGSVLRAGISKGPGFRLYVAVCGGIDVPPLFGSRATYTMGGLGGLDGRPLRKGDRLPIGGDGTGGDGTARPRRFRESSRPAYTRDWEIEAVPGPQAAPDYLTEADMREFFGRTWAVDRNSDRTGIRLESFRFQWARSGGGIAGGHPSNILDNPYPVGAVNLNGDLPVILGPDGPTAGGFVVAATVTHADLWKIGQLRPIGDRLRFRQVTAAQATEREREQRERLSEASLEDA
ncbi:MAG TPA: 5-oxoprolinase/urea amidolyase family protein [Streptosporangiaceae bacterium]|nr:5-oxoprolinase/urea amidolyase family protein [Streptosporangiaceae bacterium]